MPTSCVGLIAIYKSLYLGQVPILKKNQLGSADIVGTIEFLFALKEMPNNNQVSNILPTHSTASAFSPVKQVNNSRSKYLLYDCCNFLHLHYDIISDIHLDSIHMKNIHEFELKKY